MLKEYIVSLKRDVDYNLFWSQMESETNGLLFVPNRRVDIVNNRDGSLRSCHYSLSDEEATTLQNDDRVYSVEIPPDQRTDIQIGIRSRQTGSFNKPVTSNGANVNWGLVRISNNNNNVFGTNLSPTVTGYDYFLDGTGVDVVIQDSGLEVAHPEFTDANGNSRVQQIDWYTASGLGGSQNGNHYRDFDGHGTHVAGIVAGKNFGWAKNANVYSLKVNGLEGSGDSGTGISISDCFDVIKLWHRNKPVQASTGKKRPTIVNMSW
jgi:subtilisin family serine protease